MAVVLAPQFTITGNEPLVNISLNGNTVTVKDWTDRYNSPISYESGAANPTINDSTIQGSDENSNSYAVAVDSCGNLTVKNSNFINNCNNIVNAATGGAIFIEGANNLIENCVFSDNYAAADYAICPQLIGTLGTLYAKNGVGGALWIGDDNDVSGIDAFVTIKNTSFKTDEDTILCEGQMTLEGKVSFAGSIIMYADGDQKPQLINNGEMIFDLSERDTDDGVLLNDWSTVSGDGSFKIALDAEGQDFGNYELAYNAAGFDKTFTITCGNFTGSLSMENSEIENGDNLYALKNENGKLSLLVADKKAALDDWDDIKEKGAEGRVDKSIGTVNGDDIEMELISNGYVGPTDKIDYLQFTLESAAKLNLTFEASNTTLFTICTLNANNTLAPVQSVFAYKDGDGSINGALFEKGTYYIKVENTYGGGKDASYEIELKDGSIFYDYDDKGGNELAKATDKSVLDSENFSTFKINDWVGYGDTNDYFKFELGEAAKLSFNINGSVIPDTLNYLTFTLYKEHDQNPGYIYAVQSAAALPNAEGTFDVNTAGTLMESGTYYIGVSNAYAAYGGAADYTVKVNNASFYTKSNDKENDKLDRLLNKKTTLTHTDSSLSINDWVGYGDTNDYFKFELGEAAKLSFKISGSVATDTLNYLTLTIYKEHDLVPGYFYAVQSAAVLPNGTFDVNTAGTLMESGIYYIGVSNAYAAYGGSADYTVSINTATFYEKSNDKANDKLDSLLNKEKTLTHTDSSLSINDWVGYGDTNDYFKFELGEAAKLSFKISGSVATDSLNYLTLTIYKEHDLVPGYFYAVQSAAVLPNGTFDVNTAGTLMESGTYYIGVSNIYAPYGGSADYTVSLNTATFYEKSNDKANDKLDSLLGSEKTLTHTDSSLSINDWVGYGDTNDYFKFELGEAAKLSFKISGNVATDSLNYLTLTIYKEHDLVPGYFYAVQSAAVLPNGTFDVNTAGTLMESGTYYIGVSNIYAPYGGSADYTVSLNTATFYEKSNDKENDKLDSLLSSVKTLTHTDSSLSINDWVGYGDTNDYFKFELGEAAKLSFKISGNVATDSLNYLTLTIYKEHDLVPGYFYAVQSAAVLPNGTFDVNTAGTLMESGTYYIGVSNAYAAYGGSADYTVSINTATFYEKSNDKANDKLDSSLGSEKTLTHTDSSLSINDWVGYGDTNDYFKFELGEAAKLSFKISGNVATDSLNYLTLTIYKEHDLVPGYFYAVQSAAVLPNGTFDVNTAGTLMESGTYYIGVSNIYAPYGGSADYTVSLDMEKSTFYDKADDQKDNFLYNAANGYFNANLKNAGSDSEISTRNERGDQDVDWVGFGDNVDYYKFTLDNAANISFKVQADGVGLNYLVFTVYKKAAVGNYEYGYAVLSQAFLLNDSEYTLDTSYLLLEKGEYYFSVQNSYDYLGGSAEYSVQIGNIVTYERADNGNDNWLYNAAAGGFNRNVKNAYSDSGITAQDWVGFGDNVDYYKFDLTQAAKLSFDVQATGAGSNYLIFTVYNSYGQAIQQQILTQNGNTYTADTAGMLFTAGEYYFSVQNYYDYLGGSAEYSVSIDSANSSFFTKSNDKENDKLESSLELAGTVSKDTPVEVNDWVGFGDATDYHRFQVADDMKVNFTITTDALISFAVYNAQGGLLQYLYYDSGTNATAALDLKAGQDYYFAVTSLYAASGADIDYDVTISRYIPSVTKNYGWGNAGSIQGDDGNDIITFLANTNSEFSTISLGDGNDIINIQDSTYYWDGGEFECYEVENADLTPGTIDLGAGNDTMTVGKTRELEAISINMGSGDDKIILKADSMLELYTPDGMTGSDILFGDGNDSLIVESGNEWETELCGNTLDFGKGNDSFEIGNDCEIDVYSSLNFGSGDDKLSVGENSMVVFGSQDLTFGDGNDTLELNGVLALFGGGSITGCETISGKGEVVFLDASSIDSDLKEKLTTAGINIVDGQKLGGCKGTASEHSDDIFSGVELNDVELGDHEDFWLCGSSIAAQSDYGLADEVDYFLFQKNANSQELVVYAYPSDRSGFTVEILDINGNKTNYSLMANDYGYESDVTSWQNGDYLIKLSVNSSTRGNGYIMHYEKD